MSTPRTATRTATRTAATVTLLLALACGCSSKPATATPDPSTTAVSTTPIPAPSSAAPAPTPAASAPAMPTGAPGRPRGLPAAAVDTASAEAVARAFLSTTFTYDTPGDVSEFDAQARSAAYATPAFAVVLTTPGAQTGSASFTTLAAHQGFTTVALAANVDDGQPPDQLRTAARSYSVTVTGQGAGGWTAQLTTTTVYVFLTRTGASAPWQVERVSFGLGQ